MDGSTAMVIERMGFLTNGISRNNIPRCLLKLLADVTHLFGTILPNFSSQHPSVSNSNFYRSTGSRHIPTVSVLPPLPNHEVHCQFCVPQLIRYVTYESAISVISRDYTFSNFEISKLGAILYATAFVVVYHTLFKGGDRHLYQDRSYLRLQSFPIICL